jgi:hypothetical protein
MRRQMRNRTDMLDRIIMLLLALAGLAERAAGASLPVRCLILCPLRLADTVARRFIADMATTNPLPPANTERLGLDTAAALAIALSLRTLAFTLQAIVKQMRLSSSHARSPAANDSSLQQLIQNLSAAICPPRLDTS